MLVREKSKSRDVGEKMMKTVAELATNSGGGGRKKNLTSKLKLGQGGYGNGTVYKGKLLNKLIVQ
jgi:hypothetical protein